MNILGAVPAPEPHVALQRLGGARHHAAADGGDIYIRERDIYRERDREI